MKFSVNESVKNKIPFLIIMINPILDIVFNIFREMDWKININQSVRIVILLYIFYSTIRSKYAKHAMGLSIFFIALNLIQSVSGYSASLVQDVSFSFRVIYGIYICLYYYELMIVSNQSQMIWRGIQYSSRFIILGVLLSLIGFGHFGWKDSGRVFYKGYFSGQNIITICLLIYIGILLYKFAQKRTNKHVIEIIVSMLTVVIIGTRAGFLGVVALCLSVIAYSGLLRLKNPKNKFKYLKEAYYIVAAVIFVISVFYVSNQISHFQKNGYNNLISIITSNRNIMINRVMVAYNSGNKFLYFLFGMGYSNISNYFASIGASYRSIETDFIGLFFYTGFFGLLVFIGIYCYPLCFYFKSKAKSYLSILSKPIYFLIITYLLVFVQSFIAGHVLYETFTAHYFYYLLILIIMAAKEKVL